MTAPRPTAHPSSARERLLQRRDSARPEDSAMGMIFEGALQLSTKELGETATRMIREGAGVSPKLSTFLRYSITSYLNLLDGIALALEPRGTPYEQSLHRLGEMAVTAFFASPVGKTMIALNGGSVHRMLIAAPVAYNGVFSYGKRRYEKRGEKRAAMHYLGELLGPEAECGILDHGLFASCDVRTRLTVESVGETTSDFVIDIQW